MSNPVRSPRSRRAARGRPPWRRCRCTAAAAAHSHRGPPRPRRLAGARAGACSATTPPPNRTRETRVRRAASSVLATCTSTIASGSSRRDPGRRSSSAARSACTWRSTAVLSPLIEKSRSPEPSIARGTAPRPSLVRAAASSAGPPGNPSPSSRATCRRPPRRIVERLVEYLVTEHRGHVHEHRVAPADDQRHVRSVGPPMLQEVCPVVRLEVVDADRAPVASATDLAAAIPTSSALDQPRPDGDRDPAEIAEVQARVLQRLGEQRVERLDVRPGGDLGHDRRRSAACRCSWRAIRFVRTGKPSSTIATAVSSQEVSMPSVITPGGSPRAACSGSTRCADGTRARGCRRST